MSLPLTGAGPSRKGIEFLFRDDFNTPEAAPLTSPRTAEPGPGTGTAVDTGNFATIASGRLAISDVTGNADPSYADDIARDRDVGLMAYVIANMDGRCYVGFDSVKNTLPADTAYHFVNSTSLRIRDNALDIVGVESVTAATDYQLGLILRGFGAFYVIRGGTEFPEWTLVWVGSEEIEGSQFAQIACRVGGNDTFQFDDFRLSQLPPPWDTDFGIATDRLAGARSAGDTFVHEADSIIEFTATTVPSGDQIEFRFRINDATGSSEDLWQVTIDSSGDIDLDEVVGGGVTQRGTSASAVSNGHRIVIVSDDEVIKVYVNDVLKITYSSAATYKTETSGELETEGTGGSVSDIISWPRVISGSALPPLNRVANA